MPLRATDQSFWATFFAFLLGLQLQQGQQLALLLADQGHHIVFSYMLTHCAFGVV